MEVFRFQQCQRLLEGEAACATGWNFGPDSAEVLTVRDVLERFRAGLPDLNVNYGDDQPDLHEANALRLDCNKANTELNWLPVWDSRRAIDQAAEWYAAHLTDGTLATDSDIDAFVADAATAGQRWAEA